MATVSGTMISLQGLLVGQHTDAGKASENLGREIRAEPSQLVLPWPPASLGPMPVASDHQRASLVATGWCPRGKLEAWPTYQGSPRKSHRPGRLHQQKRILSQLWRPEALRSGANRAASSRGRGGACVCTLALA